MFELLIEKPMDLQMFANDGIYGTGDETDDPNAHDDVADTPEEEDYDGEEFDEDDLAALLDGGEEEDEAQDDETVEEPEEPITEETQQTQQPQGKLYTQEEINNIISSRLQREQSKYQGVDATLNAVRELEEAAGMPMHDILNEVKGNRVQAYMESGMTEEEARQRLDMEMQFKTVKQELDQTKQNMQNFQRSMRYNNEKAAVINTNPLFRKFERDIDQFARYGEVLSFTDAARYVIGDKLARGELADDIRRGAESRALAQNQRGFRHERGGQPGGPKQNQRLSSSERQIARGLGLSEKEWNEGKKAVGKQRKKRA